MTACKKRYRIDVDTKVIKVNAVEPEKEALREAAKIIKNGGIVAFPTETVYGMGVDYVNKEAIQKLYRVKKRPKDRPFTVHISKFEDLKDLSCNVTHFSGHMIEKFWPGPLTIIFNTRSGDKIGVRMPNNRVALDFIFMCNAPIVAPSANIFGNKPPCSAEDVLMGLDGKIDLLLDSGATDMGKESTVVDASRFPYRILREGAIEKSRITDIGRELQK